MELSSQLKNSLILINNVNNINDDGFRKLLDNAFGALLNKPDIHNLTTLNSSKNDVIKEVYASLLTLILEFVRNGLTNDLIRIMLVDELNWNANRLDLFCRLYEKQKERLEIAISSIGTHPPHIVDVHWKIDYVIETNVLDVMEGPIYRIRLSTEVFDIQTQAKQLKYVHFTCNVQQLQHLVYQLKDALRHCEKLSTDNS